MKCICVCRAFVLYFFLAVYKSDIVVCTLRIKKSHFTRASQGIKYNPYSAPKMLILQDRILFCFTLSKMSHNAYVNPFPFIPSHLHVSSGVVTASRLFFFLPSVLSFHFHLFLPPTMQTFKMSNVEAATATFEKQMKLALGAVIDPSMIQNFIVSWTK